MIKMGSEAEKITALDAKTQAQWIAFSPFVFHATVIMRDRGILEAISNAGDEGVNANGISDVTNISLYGVKVLLDFALNIGLVFQKGNKFVLGKVGYFILNDEMTRVNTNFTRDVCYDALSGLDQSIEEGEPRGLKNIGDWERLYEGLSIMPEPARKSWFSFDHYYSDRVFDEFISIVFETPVKEILDVGGNTGRWAIKCLSHDPEVKVTIMDLPVQINVARRNIEEASFSDRFIEFPIDMLNGKSKFYQGADVIWMSQFLDCFAEDEILCILQRAVEVMDGNTILYIVELFWDRQRYEAASFSLNATSLYFTCVANGKSRMYHSNQMKRLVQEAGLIIEKDTDDIGVGHTVFRCRKAN